MVSSAQRHERANRRWTSDRRCAEESKLPRRLGKQLRAGRPAKGAAQVQSHIRFVLLETRCAQSLVVGPPRLPRRRPLLAILLAADVARQGTGQGGRDRWARAANPCLPFFSAHNTGAGQ
jgi:hypothetical protein